MTKLITLTLTLTSAIMTLLVTQTPEHLAKPITVGNVEMFVYSKPVDSYVVIDNCVAKIIGIRCPNLDELLAGVAKAAQKQSLQKNERFDAIIVPRHGAAQLIQFVQ